MFLLDASLAQSIVDRAMQILRTNVNVMDERGLVIASVGMCSPRSTLPMCERSMPARCASDSCAIPRSNRSARTAAPKA